MTGTAKKRPFTAIERRLLGKGFAAHHKRPARYCRACGDIALREFYDIRRVRQDMAVCTACGAVEAAGGRCVQC